MLNIETKTRNFLIQSNKIEGIDDVVTEEDEIVLLQLLLQKEITVDNLCDVAFHFQRDARLRDGISSFDNVKVGNHNAPQAGPEVKRTLEVYLRKMADCRGDKSRAYDLHKAYEKLHPFTDCNGRTGRILLWWMMEGDFGPYDFLTWWYIQSQSE